MDSLQKVYDVTMELLDVLESNAENDREKKIETIHRLLDEREQQIKAIQPPFSEEEQVLGRKLIEQNQKVDEFLQKQKREIQFNIKQLSVKKKSSRQYTNPYENMSIDGMFYDKRK
jgi:flagellar protein FliT